MLNQGLDVLCCLLDASFVFWVVWAQPHQSNGESITIFMLNVEGDPGCKGTDVLDMR
jgi:hypothetical protein